MYIYIYIYNIYNIYIIYILYIYVYIYIYSKVLHIQNLAFSLVYLLGGDIHD